VRPPVAGSRAGLLVLGKYLLFQVPGWLAVGALAWAAHRWLGLDARLAILACVAWVAKDLVLFAFVRDAYAVTTRPAGAHLLGARAIAEEPLAPEGLVRIGPELWRARLAAGEPPVPAGAAVTVEAVEGLTLRVRGANGATSAGASTEPVSRSGV
jgi:membrane protein implicated in regulation of membrane protease activity